MLRRTRGASDADAGVAARMAVEESSWPTATEVDTTGTSEQSLAEALAAVDAGGLRPTRLDAALSAR